MSRNTGRIPLKVGRTKFEHCGGQEDWIVFWTVVVVGGGKSVFSCQNCLSLQCCSPIQMIINHKCINSDYLHCSPSQKISVLLCMSHQCLGVLHFNYCSTSQISCMHFSTAIVCIVPAVLLSFPDHTCILMHFSPVIICIVPAVLLSKPEGKCIAMHVSPVSGCIAF